MIHQLLLIALVLSKPLFGLGFSITSFPASASQRNQLLKPSQHYARSNKLRPPNFNQAILLTKYKNYKPRYNTPNTHTTQLQMGLFDFFKSRENDFVKLDQTSTYGPGPVIILYNVPDGILDEEIRDMIDDGIVSSNSGHVKFTRLSPADLDSIGELTVQQVLDKAVENTLVSSTTRTPVSTVSTVSSSSSPLAASKNFDTKVQMISITNSENERKLTSENNNKNEPYVPILYFSGISNTEMMETYNIIGKEIYEESGGLANAACAKAVEPAMGKSFCQLIGEISGDHTDAMKLAAEQ